MQLYRPAVERQELADRFFTLQTLANTGELAHHAPPHAERQTEVFPES